MKIVLVNGSPKTKGSASGALLQMMKTHLDAEEKIMLQWNRDEISEQDLQTVAQSDGMVLAFPLYVDALPSHTLRCIKQLEPFIKTSEKPFRVFVIVNNGFYNAHQNRYAVEVIRNWCGHANAVFVGGLCVGAGGMVPELYESIGENGPIKPIAEAVKAAGEKIADVNDTDGNVTMAEPAFPEFLYQQAAQMGWRKTAKMNGLRVRDLNKQ